MGWGGESILHCQGHPICMKSIVSWESGIPVPNAQAKLRYTNNSREDDVVVSGTWLSQREVELLRYPGQPMKNTGVQHMQQRVQSSSAHTHIFMGENCLRHWQARVTEPRIHILHLPWENWVSPSTCCDWLWDTSYQKSNFNTYIIHTLVMFPVPVGHDSFCQPKLCILLWDRKSVV